MTVWGADRPFVTDPGAGRSPVIAKHGMVATSQPIAAQAGLRILQQGGNAVDAAVATAAVLAVVEPMMTGPGGDVFALVWIEAEQKLYGLNASGFSPASVTLDFFAEKELESIPTTGPYSVSVPGAVDGWITILEAHGSLSIDEVLAPAIAIAEEGFGVSEIIAGDWADKAAKHAEKPAFADAFLIEGEAPAHGQIFRNPDLAKTYRAIAEHGREGFYGGWVGQAIVDHLNEQGWPITLDDLAYQHSDWVEPISTTYRDIELFELPPNGQGMAALEMLNIVEAYDFSQFEHNSAAYLHLLIEAKKLAFGDLRAWLADPERVDLPVSEIISKEHADRQRRRIDRQHAAEEFASPIERRIEFLEESGDTVYLTVVDEQRNAVSFINSIFHGFGSGEVAPGTGVILQNRGALFTLDSEHPNRLESRKRPYHTIIPAMAFKGGKPWITFGVMGGAMQPQGHTQVLLNRIEYGMDIQAAGEAPRFRHLYGAGVALESGIGQRARQGLRGLGHGLTAAEGAFGGYQAIEIDWEQGLLWGGTDRRKDGAAVGW